MRKLGGCPWYAHLDAPCSAQAMRGCDNAILDVDITPPSCDPSLTSIKRLDNVSSLSLKWMRGFYFSREASSRQVNQGDHMLQA